MRKLSLLLSIRGPRAEWGRRDDGKAVQRPWKNLARLPRPSVSLFLIDSGKRRQSVGFRNGSVFSHILLARTTQRKHSPSIVAWRRPHRKHVLRVRLWVHWSVTSTGRGADDTENTASSIVACWAVFTELLSGNALMKLVEYGLGQRSTNWLKTRRLHSDLKC
jgi:hypothetical protein